MSEESRQLTVAPDQAGQRLDRFLTGALEIYTRSFLKKLIDAGAVTVNGIPVKGGLKLAAGDRVCVDVPPRRPEGILPEDVPLHIVFEDDDLAVLEKPPGMTVHPGAGRCTGTLVNALLARFSSLSTLAGPARPGIVHRLDRDTSGLIIIAKSDAAHERLQEQFRGRKVQKHYTALVWGCPRDCEGTIALPIGRGRRDRKKMSVRTAAPRDAVTSYRVAELLGPIARLEISLHTGRTHQIRVHLSSLGHPILGDGVYGGRRWKEVKDPKMRELLRGVGRQALHAGALSFLHPVTGQRLSFHSALPEDMERILTALRSMVQK
jgi:23S rRNA pseudouridine1911/1915/1917 synthase